MTAADIRITVTEKKSHEPIIMGTVMLNPIGLGVVTNMEGVAVLSNVPNGQYTLAVSYVGFQTRQIQVRVDGKDLAMKVELEEASPLARTSAVPRHRASLADRPSTTCRPPRWQISCSWCPAN